MATIKIKRTTGPTPPSGLTFGELAFVQGITSLYVTNNLGTSLRIGAEVDASTSLGTSDNKLPTQNAVKQYVDNALAGVGTNVFNQIGIVGQDGLTADSTSDTLNFVAGNGINLTTTAATDTVTFALSNSVTIANDLTVTGNLTVNGSTVTVNANTLAVDDPIIYLGLSGGLPITQSDGSKDRGFALNYWNGSNGVTGFVGYDVSAAKYIFASDATISSEVVSAPTFAPVHAKEFYVNNNATSATGLITHSLASTNRTWTFKDYDGVVLTPATEGTNNYILKSTSAQPVWIDPTAAGFTAFAATKLASAVTISLGSDLSGSASFDGSGNITINATIAANSVALGTDTTGQYASTIASSGSGLSITTPNADDGTSYTVALTKINTGIDFGTFAFTTNEFTNTGGTVAIGTVDGGTY